MWVTLFLLGQLLAGVAAQEDKPLEYGVDVVRAAWWGIDDDDTLLWIVHLFVWHSTLIHVLNAL